MNQHGGVYVDPQTVSAVTKQQQSHTEAAWKLTLRILATVLAIATLALAIYVVSNWAADLSYLENSDSNSYYSYDYFFTPAGAWVALGFVRHTNVLPDTANQF